jgi:hypothetical protein
MPAAGSSALASTFDTANNNFPRFLTCKYRGRRADNSCTCNAGTAAGAALGVHSRLAVTPQAHAQRLDLEKL